MSSEYSLENIPKYNFSEAAYYKAHIENEGEGIHVGEPLQDADSGEWFFCVSKKIIRKGKLIGIIRAVVDPIDFKSFTDLIGEDSNATIILLHKNGRIISISNSEFDNEKWSVGDRFLDEENLKIILAQEDKISDYGFDKDYMVILSELRGINLKDLYLVNIMPKLNFRDAMTNEIKLELFVYFFLILLIVFFNIYSKKIIIAKEEAENRIIKLNKALESKVDESTEKLFDSLREIKKLQNEIIQHERLVSLGGMVAGISHEINTPIGVTLTAVTTLSKYVDIFNEKTKNRNISEEEFLDYIEKINTGTDIIKINVNKAASLIKSFKQISVDLNYDNVREVELQEFIENLVRSLTPVLKKTGIHVKSMSSIERKIKIFPGSISQVLTNLLMNAMIHGYDNKEGEIEINSELNEEGVLISVIDHGQGMSEEALKRIFEPFYTTKRGNGGTGLGMNIVWNIIVNNLHGDIKVESEIDKGTKVLLTIPLL